MIYGYTHSVDLGYTGSKMEVHLGRVSFIPNLFLAFNGFARAIGM